MRVAVRLPHMKKGVILFLDDDNDEMEFWVCYILNDLKRMEVLINRLQNK